MGLSDYRARTQVKPGWLTLKEGESKDLFIPIELEQMTRILEHSSPEDFKKHALCTYPECLGCEQYAWAWAQRIKILIPLTDGRYNYVSPQGTGKGSLFTALVQEFEKYGTIVGWYRISKSGSGKRTKYTCERLLEKSTTPTMKNIDYSSHVINVNYEDQDEYYSIKKEV